VCDFPWFLSMPKRILIAEDEASVRNAVRTFIESRTHYEVSEAVDGNEAIHKAQALKPDLVVLDLRMRIANGIEVAARLNISTVVYFDREAAIELYLSNSRN
jgi:CheY-like chemotaxis protein